MSTLSFPAVIKPVDRAASDGVSICSDLSALNKAVDAAFKISYCGRIIIEQFAEGHEFTAHYTIMNGKAALSAIDNRYPKALHDGTVTTIPIARVYPSLFINPFLKKVNDKMLKLCEGIDLQDGVIFVQGIYNELDDEFYVFEAGLRPAAEAPCRFAEKLTGKNHYKMLIDKLMNIETEYELNDEDPYMRGKVCGIVSLASKGGVVAEINGLEAITNKIPGLFQYESRYPVGSLIPDGDSLRQLVMRFLLITESREELAERVEAINRTISLKDRKGNDLLVRMMPERVLGYK